MKNKRLSLKKILLCAGGAGLVLALFSACTAEPGESVDERVNVPAVDTETVDAEQFPTVHDEWATLALDAVPFQVSLPADWTFREESGSYTFVFDEGTSGSIQVAKTPLANWPSASGYAPVASGDGVTMACREAAGSGGAMDGDAGEQVSGATGGNKYCAVRVAGDERAYSVVVSWKTMDAARRVEVEAILGRLKAD